MKPTDEQIKEFWAWCGFKYGKGLNCNTLEPITGWWFNKEYMSPKNLPPIDLNNLFKYAVPKLLGGDRYLFITFDVTSNEAGLVACEISTLKGEKLTRVKWEASDNDPALALFWAIYEVIK